MQQYADQEKKKEAIAFGEWIVKQGYVRNGETWTIWEYKISHTTEQLYDIYNK